MPKEKDPRYQDIRKAFDAGLIKTFSDIFNYISIEQLSKDTGISLERLAGVVSNPAITNLPFLFKDPGTDKNSKSPDN